MSRDNAYFWQEPDRLAYTNNTGDDLPSKQVVVLASGSTGFLGITIDAIPDGETGVLAVRGGWVLPKASGEVFTMGQELYWDATNREMTGTASGNTRAGRAGSPAASSATTAPLLLNEA